MLLFLLITKSLVLHKQIVRELARHLIFSNHVSTSLYYWLARIFIHGRRGMHRRASSGDIEAAFLLGLDFGSKVVYDVGSSIGNFTRFFSASVGRKGYVVAFEPNPKPYQQLKERIGRDIGFNVLAVNMVVGNAPCNSLLIVRNIDSGTGSVDPDIQAQIIQEGDYYELYPQMCSLDSYIASEQGGRRLDFIKIDAEGAEFDILKGAIKVLQMYHPELFIEIHGATLELKQKNIKNIVRFLQEQAYSIYHVESEQEISLANCQLAREGHIYCK